VEGLKFGVPAAGIETQEVVSLQLRLLS